MRRVPLVDELLVVDSDSTDATAAVARAAGADVVATADVLPAHGTRPGKGEALWKSLAATTGDLVVFLDADLLGDVAHYVPGLLGPLLDRSAGRLREGLLHPAARGRRRRRARRRRPGHRADRPAAAQRAVAGAGRVRAAAGRRVRRPPVGAGAGAVRVGLRRGGRACSSTCCTWAGCPRWPRSTSASGGTPRSREEALGAMAGQVVSTVLARAGRRPAPGSTPAGCSPSSGTTAPASCRAAAPSPSTSARRWRRCRSTASLQAGLVG